MMRPMSTKNRQRRRMKQKRRNERPARKVGDTPRREGLRQDAPDVETIRSAVWAAAHAECDHGGDDFDRATFVEAMALGFGFTGGRALVANCVTAMTTKDLVRLLRSGWQAEDLVQVVRRRANGAASAVILDGRAAALDPDDPEWIKELSAAVAALGVLDHLPGLPDLGTFAPSGAHRRSPEEERVLIRIRALLAKAESSAFPEEADAFMAKAQELMTRHCIDDAILGEGSGAGRSGGGVEARRLWLDDPYLQAKALLLSEVATANRCRAILFSEFGFSTLVGHRADLDGTELLFTSLLVQATRRITALSSSARSRRPSYRRSFLVAYAWRIGVRLREASIDATTEANEALGNQLLPVLADRQQRVDDAVENLFGELGHIKYSAADLAGWAAGTAAADLADLAAHQTLPSEAAS